MSGTIRSRFAASVIANITRAGITFVTGLLIARVLGPEQYGRMSFLLASFLAARNLTDFNSSSAFFTFLSQRQRSKTFVKYYWIWVLIQFFAVFLLLSLFLPDVFLARLWQGEHRGLIMLAYVASFFQNSIWLNASQMGEAQRQTVKVQWVNTAAILCHLIIVLLLIYSHQLSIFFILTAMILEWGLASLIAVRLYKTADNKEDSFKTFKKEFVFYCSPFILYVVVSFAYDFADRWMLQRWGGAKEQAYYAIASQFTTIALLATTSILRIFWKEISEAHHRNDIQRVRLLYSQILKGLYFIGAAVAGAAIPWTKEIIHLVLGESYSGGAITMMLMFFYPIHQCMGQIGGTMLYATSKSKLQVAIGIFFMVLSLFVSYFLIAPPNAVIPGFGLASKGLAWKMVLLQLVSVNVTHWYICKFFKSEFEWRFQVYILLLTIGISFIIKAMIGLVVDHYGILSMIISSAIYTGAMIIVAFKFSGLTGIKLADIRGLAGSRIGTKQ